MAKPNLDQAKEYILIIEEWMRVADHWSEEENDILLRGIQKYGKDYDALNKLFSGTRTRDQIARKC